MGHLQDSEPLWLTSEVNGVCCEWMNERIVLPRRAAEQSKIAR